MHNVFEREKQLTECKKQISDCEKLFMECKNSFRSAKEHPEACKNFLMPALCAEDFFP